MENELRFLRLNQIQDKINISPKKLERWRKGEETKKYFTPDYPVPRTGDKRQEQRYTANDAQRLYIISCFMSFLGLTIQETMDTLEKCADRNAIVDEFLTRGSKKRDYLKALEKVSEQLELWGTDRGFRVYARLLLNDKTDVPQTVKIENALKKMSMHPIEIMDQIACPTDTITMKDMERYTGVNCRAIVKIGKKESVNGKHHIPFSDCCRVFLARLRCELYLEKYKFSDVYLAIEETEEEILKINREILEENEQALGEKLLAVKQWGFNYLAAKGENSQIPEYPFSEDILEQIGKCAKKIVANPDDEKMTEELLKISFPQHFSQKERFEDLNLLDMQLKDVTPVSKIVKAYAGDGATQMISKNLMLEMFALEETLLNEFFDGVMDIKRPGCVVRENVKAMQDKIRILLSKLFDENTICKHPDMVNTMIYNFISFFGRYKVSGETNMSEEKIAYWNEIVKFSLGAVDYYFKKQVYLKTNSVKIRKKA